MSERNPQLKERIAYELNVLEAMADELEAYIVKSEVYRTILVSTGRGNQKVEMSGGDLLARMQALQAMRENLTMDEKDRLNSIITKLEVTKGEFQTPFHELLRRELKSRLATLHWSRDTQPEGEKEEASAADQSNHLRIAVIREELADKQPAETADELDALEEQLNDALDRLQMGQNPSP
ncbi:MAG: hypothetical protein R3C14_26365 [Caldilineaceae bacterium]